VLKKLKKFNSITNNISLDSKLLHKSINSFELKDLIDLKYRDLFFMEKVDIIKILDKYLLLYKHSLISKFTIANFIDMYQLQELTRAFGDIGKIPAELDLLT
jgi:hypothetical protein